MESLSDVKNLSGRGPRSWSPLKAVVDQFTHLHSKQSVNDTLIKSNQNRLILYDCKNRMVEEDIRSVQYSAEVQSNSF